MAQRHHDLTAASAAGPVTTGDALEGYLRAQATEFLRALRLHREAGNATSHGAPQGASHGTSHSPAHGTSHASAGGAEERDDAARALRRSARRISATLRTFRPLLDSEWSEALRPELSWLSATLALEHAHGARLERLLLALNRLSGTAPEPSAVRVPTPVTAPGTTVTTSTPSTLGTPSTLSTVATQPIPDAPDAPDAPGTPVLLPAAPPATAATRPRTAGAARGPRSATLTVGAAKAGALLDRQLTLARTRAHSTALQALGSSRFHAVADRAAVLASEVPLTPAAATTDLRPFAAAAEERLADAVAALPLVTAGSPYNAEALMYGLSADAAPHPQDAPWHHVRLLLRLHRYACEVLSGPIAPLDDVGLLTAGAALDRHRDASEAAAAAAQAARTPRIAPATAYALGVLHADQRHEVEAARYEFQRTWQKQPVTTVCPT
ncbi:CHAD domain-containing protein [Streptomyces sp. NPDC054884]